MYINLIVQDQCWYDTYSACIEICKPSLWVPTVFIFKHFINPSMEYLIPIWWPFVSKIVQKQHGPRFSHCSCHCKAVSNSVCLSERATVTKGGGAYDRSNLTIGLYILQLWLFLLIATIYHNTTFYLAIVPLFLAIVTQNVTLILTVNLIS